MLVNKRKKSSGDVGFNALAERRVKPGYFALSLLLWDGVTGVVGKRWFKSTTSESFLV